MKADILGNEGRDVVSLADEQAGVGRKRRRAASRSPDSESERERPPQPPAPPTTLPAPKYALQPPPKYALQPYADDDDKVLILIDDDAGLHPPAPVRHIDPSGISLGPPLMPLPTASAPPPPPPLPPTPAIPPLESLASTTTAPSVAPRAAPPAQLVPASCRTSTLRLGLPSSAASGDWITFTVTWDSSPVKYRQAFTAIVPRQATAAQQLQEKHDASVKISVTLPVPGSVFIGDKFIHSVTDFAIHRRGRGRALCC